MFSSLRSAFFRMYFPVAVVAAIVLAILDATMPPALGQVRITTVTVYVTMVQTVPIYVPVTHYVTVASVATSFITFATTAVSISLGTVTLLNTVSLWNTVTTAAGGILGPMPANLFGQYSDVALVSAGVVGGTAAGFALSSLIANKWKYTQTQAQAGQGQDQGKRPADAEKIAAPFIPGGAVLTSSISGIQSLRDAAGPGEDEPPKGA